MFEKKKRLVLALITVEDLDKTEFYGDALYEEENSRRRGRKKVKGGELEA